MTSEKAKDREIYNAEDSHYVHKFGHKWSGYTFNVGFKRRLSTARSFWMQNWVPRTWWYPARIRAFQTCLRWSRVEHSLSPSVDHSISSFSLSKSWPSKTLLDGSDVCSGPRGLYLIWVQKLLLNSSHNKTQIMSLLCISWAMRVMRQCGFNYCWQKKYTAFVQEGVCARLVCRNLGNDIPE